MTKPDDSLAGTITLVMILMIGALTSKASNGNFSRWWDLKGAPALETLFSKVLWFLLWAGAIAAAGLAAYLLYKFTIRAITYLYETYTIIRRDDLKTLRDDLASAESRVQLLGQKVDDWKGRARAAEGTLQALEEQKKKAGENSADIVAEAIAKTLGVHHDS